MRSKQDSIVLMLPVDCTMTNIQNFGLAKTIGSVTESKPVKDI